MKIEGTMFGSITIGETTYNHDVIVGLTGKVRKRKKELSKEQYGTSHIISKREAEFVYEQGCRELIIGTGQYGSMRLSAEAEAYFQRKGCRIISEPTAVAINRFNESQQRKIGLFHVTC